MKPAADSPRPERAPWFRLSVQPPDTGRDWIGKLRTMRDGRALLDLYAEAAVELAGSLRELVSLDADAPRSDTLAAIARKSGAEAEVEGIAAWGVLVMWDDPSGELETRGRWLAGDYASEVRPHVAAGVALIEELVDAGWSPVEIDRLGLGVVGAVRRMLAGNPAAEEVQRKAADFPQTGAPTT